MVLTPRQRRRLRHRLWQARDRVGRERVWAGDRRLAWIKVPTPRMTAEWAARLPHYLQTG